MFSEAGFALVCEEDNQYKDYRSIVNVLSAQPIRLKQNFLRPWDIQASLPCPPPFSATYKIGTREIIFVAVEHVSGPVSPEDKGLKTISKLIESHGPEGVVVETATGGVMPQEAFDGITNDCYQEWTFVCGEAAYAAVIVAKSGAEVHGGEPVPPVLNDLIQNRVGMDNLLAYRSTQAVLSFKRQGVPKREWEKKLPEELERNAISKGEAWSFAQYSEWTKKNLNLSPEEVEDSWIEPKNDETSNALHKIAFLVDISREPLIVSTVERVINSHDKAMIIYGAGHFYKQALVYEEAFGTPKIECLGNISVIKKEKAPLSAGPLRSVQ
jgi:hypothetical protein